MGVARDRHHVAARLKKRLVLSGWLERFTHFKSGSALGGRVWSIGVERAGGAQGSEGSVGTGWQGTGLLAEERRNWVQGRQRP